MKIGIIGGGASGIMLGNMLNNTDAHITILEKTQSTLNKLLITGNGRCNITNLCEPEEFVKNIAHNSKFMYSAIYNFSPSDMVNYLNNNGLATKAEDNFRIFPISNRSRTVKEFLDSHINNINLVTNAEVTDIIQDNNQFIVNTLDKRYIFDIVVIATGGLSYPTTGSSGDGLMLAKRLGLDVTLTRPSLCSIRLDNINPNLEGTPFSCLLKYYKNSKLKNYIYGDGLFTSFGVSGPAVFKLTSIIQESSINKDIFALDFCSELSSEDVRTKIKEYIKDNPKKYIIHLINSFVTLKIAKDRLNRLNIDEQVQCACVSNAMVMCIADILKNYTFTINNFDNIERATITRGGVDVKQLNPHTMECKSIPNLYFIGEVIDVDAFSGGFNLQIAFSTAVACADDIKQKLRS